MKTTFTRFLFMLLAMATISTSAFAIFPKPVSTQSDSLAIKASLAAFNNLSKREKKHRIKEVKKVIKDYKAAKKAGDDISTNTLLLVILAILLPPLAVYLHEGETNNRFWISVILTLIALILSLALSGFFWLLSIAYALIVVLG